jgi:hypothetical protein
MVSHLLLANRTEEVKKRRTKQISAPCLFQANRLLTELYKQETEYVEEKTMDTLKINISLLLDPPPFLLPTTFKQLGAHKTLAVMPQPAARPLEAAARRQTGTYPELFARGGLARQSGHTRQLGGGGGRGMLQPSSPFFHKPL